jgi:hypothetical protein
LLTSFQAQQGDGVVTTEISAQIIPFPPRQPVAQTQVSPVSDVASTQPAMGQQAAPHDRLTRALAALDAALNEQRAAMAGWRDTLEQLRKTTTGLGLSMQRYSRALGKLGDDVAELNAGATRLERWADGAMRSTVARPGQTASRVP